MTSTSSAYFYTVALGAVLGVAFGSSSTFGVFESLVLGVLALGFCGLYVVQGRQCTYVYAALCCASIMAGALHAHYALAHMSHELDAFEGKHVELTGVVVREPERRERTTHLTVEVERVDFRDVHGTVLVFHDRLSQVAYGDRVVIQGEVSRPDAFTTEFGRTFNYAGYLRAQGIDHTVIYPQVEVLSGGEGLHIVSALYTFKQSLSASIDAALRAPESGLALGILLGEKQALGKELLDTFRNAGLIHIVVLSGYNIALLIAACMWVLRRFSLRAQNIIGGMLIIGFVTMVGPSATVLRAAVMAALVLVARATGRTYAILRALVIAGLLMLIVNPFLLLYDPGFQLSFLATFGLIALASHFERPLGRVPNFLGAREYLVATLAAQIMTFPIIAYSIGSVSAVAVMANVLVLPVIPYAMLLAAFVGFVGFISEGTAFLLGYPAYLVLKYVIVLGEFFGGVPYASFTLPPFSFVWVVGMYVFIGACVLMYQMRSTLQNLPPKPTASMGDPIPF
jgi:competence protein ComEC